MIRSGSASWSVPLERRAADEWRRVLEPERPCGSAAVAGVVVSASSASPAREGAVTKLPVRSEAVSS